MHRYILIPDAIYVLMFQINICLFFISAIEEGNSLCKTDTAQEKGRRKTIYNMYSGLKVVENSADK